MSPFRFTFGISAVVILTVLAASLAPSQDLPAPPPPADNPPTPAQENPAPMGLLTPTTQPTSTTQPATTQPGNGEANGLILPNGKVLLNFRNASLDAVLSFLSEAGGLTVINDVKLDGRINVLNRQPMTIEEALAVLDTLLKDHGYAAVHMGKTLKIVPLDAAKKATIPVRTGNNPQAIAQTDEVITQVIPVRFADAAQLKRDLAPLVPSYADLSANVSTNTLILTDTSANVRRVVEIISSLDTSVATITRVKVFPLKYANAANAARLISDVFRQDQQGGTAGQRNQPFGIARFFGGGGGGGPFGGRGGGPGTPGAAGATDEGGAGRPQARVTAASDDRTNTVVVSAPVDIMGVIETVLHDLDANPSQDQTVFIYYLRNADAANVQNVINNLFNATGTGGVPTSGRTTTGMGTTGTSRTGTYNNTGAGTRGGTSSSGTSSFNLGSFGSGATAGRTNTAGTGGGRTSGGAAAAPRLSAGAAQTAASLAGQVYAVADADTNSVLIMTSSGNMDRVKAVLLELDRPMPQVLIKVLLAEVTHDNDTDLGVEFSAINLKTSGKNTVFTDFGIAAIPSPAGGLIAKVVETDVTAAINALQKVGKIDVLSRPYILASDNQLAAITVGQTVPYITDVLYDINNSPRTSINYRDIGIILNVTPHINPDGVVIMDVAPEISAITDSTIQIVQGFNAAVFSKRAASTRVAIHDGQTIVIGGLMQDQKNQTVNKVPLLGDIPLAGLLFQRNQTKITKSELLIFLTPHVAMEPGRLQKMSEDEKKGAVGVPEAVDKGVYEQHLRGLERGGTTTQPAEYLPAPTTLPDP